MAHGQPLTSGEETAGIHKGEGGPAPVTGLGYEGATYDTGGDRRKVGLGDFTDPA